ncbi:MAG TPA: ComF family protein [Polyangiaceae bacterium]|nr:ComF family protein [Polyangiaceae bacterium]
MTIPLLRPLAGPIAFAARGAVQLALPACCPACRSLTDEHAPLCALCARTLDAIDEGCPRCGLPLPPVERPPPRPPPRCLGCLRAPPAWESAHAPFAFTGELQSAIRRWKLGPDPSVTRPLAQLLAPAIGRFAACDAFVPVPLHARRLRWRGFNQASVLIRSARSRAPPPLPAVEELLDRTRDTPPQSTLDAAARRANVRDAFAVPRPERVRGRYLCLVDDVLTTGATAAACARALRRAGARRVDVLTLARALP